MRIRGMVVAVAAFILFTLLNTTPVEAAGGRRVKLDDMNLLRSVGGVQVSPDGKWIAYTVTGIDVEKDKSNTDIWMTSWDGKRTLMMTTSPDSESSPRFSPDGRYLSFLSSRNYEDETSQVWLLPRRGGEAERITDIKGGVSGYDWSPDGRRLVLVVKDPKPEKKEDETAPPIVIDRYHFKQDYQGYLGDRRSHLYLFDIESRSIETLTDSRFDEMAPSFSPDGTRVAFISKRGKDPDRHDNLDIYIIDAKAGATERQLTKYEGSDGSYYYSARPVWSPDGKRIAYVRSGDPDLDYYSVQSLAVISAAGGDPVLAADGLDRNVYSIGWSDNGSSITFIVEDDGSAHVARVPAAGGRVQRILTGRRNVSSLAFGPGGKIALLQSTVHRPTEVYVLENGDVRQISHANDRLVEEWKLGAVDEIRFKSSVDGTEIGGFVVKPQRYREGKKYPTVLWIHGGPVGQFANSFQFDWQLFAAEGYVVVAVNPRGSSGRGEDFQKAIWANWGRDDAKDVIAGVDHLIDQGIADAKRLGVTGWSYGGMMTDYVIAQDTRFKAALSGAGIANMFAGYGHDQYIKTWERELGKPWENPDAWIHNSFPFLEAHKIKTPTLFMCGEKDFNVPLIGSEQMYMALKSEGIDTQLVIYPGQNHGLSIPSYRIDRLQRRLDWMGKYLK